MKISCIIPCYNDNAFLPDILASLEHCPSISEVICVDDGSTELLSKSLPSQYSKVRILREDVNKGKSNAVKSATKHLSNDIVLLLDADLYEMDHTELAWDIKYFGDHSLDLLLISSTKYYFFNRLSRHNLLFTGVRLLKKELLTELFQHENPNRYQFEIGMNRYFRKIHKKVCHTYLQFGAVHKEEKIGWLRGTLSNILMLKSIILYKFPEYLMQVFFFGHQSISVKQ